MSGETTRKQTAAGIHARCESRLQEVKRLKTEAEEELEAAHEKWRSERHRMRTEIDRLEAALAEVKAGSRKTRRTAKETAGPTTADLDKLKTTAEERFARAAEAWTAEKDNLTREISRLELAVAELLERSNNPLRSTLPEKERLESGLRETVEAKQRLEQELSEGRKEWEKEKLRLTGEIVKLRRSGSPGKSARKKIENEDAARETKDGNADKERAAKEQELTQRIEAIQQDLGSQLKDAQTQVRHLEKRLSETKDMVNAEVVEQLRQQYDERLSDTIREKTQLAEELQHASSLLESERRRFKDTAASTPEMGTDFDAVDAEVARVEKLIAEIGRLIDDPATELSTVIRKNVERAELDAYLKGVLFSVGRSRVG